MGPAGGKKKASLHLFSSVPRGRDRLCGAALQIPDILSVVALSVVVLAHLDRQKDCFSTSGSVRH